MKKIIENIVVDVYIIISIIVVIYFFYQLT
jgi:hypothetical protein